MRGGQSTSLGRVLRNRDRWDSLFDAQPLPAAEKPTCWVVRGVCQKRTYLQYFNLILRDARHARATAPSWKALIYVASCRLPRRMA
jgi:hypothetical protein